MSLQTGIFSDLLAEAREREYRSTLENPQVPLSYPAEWMLDIFNGGRTDSGIRVSELLAFQTTVFLACVDLISGAIAGLPLHVYERSFLGNGRAAHRIAYDHDLYDLIHIEPNDEMSAFTMLKAFVMHALAWPSAYIEIQRDAANRAVALWPRNPAKTRPFRASEKMVLRPESWRPFPVTIQSGEFCFKTTDGIDDEDRSFNDAERSTAGRFIPAADMLHVPGMASFDGRIGQGVVWLARQTIGLALQTEKFGAKYFANFAKPGGILIPPAAVNAQAREQAKRSWLEAQGGENAHRVAVMPSPGWDWKPMSNNPQEAQALETKKDLRIQICSVFHVPPHMVGEAQTSRSNTEQLAQEFVGYALTPHLRAIKQEWKRKLFPNSGIGRTPKSRFYVDFDLWGLLRPTAADREKFYSTIRQWGIGSVNDCREYEGLNPIDQPWADEHWMPVNMTLVDTPINPNSQDGAGNGSKSELKGVPKNGNRRSLPTKEELYLVRHGSTNLNDEGKLRGHLDIDLNAQGIEDSDTIAQWFAENDLDIGRIVSSDLKRAQQTARIIGEKLKVKVATDSDLRPWDVGLFEGQQKNGAFQKYIDDPDLCVPGGESLNAFLKRWLAAFKKYLANASEDTILVTHTSNIQSASNYLKFGNPLADGRPEELDLVGPGGAICVEPGGQITVAVKGRKSNALPIGL